MIAEVSLPPFESPIKIFIFHDAEKMLPSSANALLKTLEEPPSDTYILLLTTNPGAIIPTIISRCRLIPFAPKPASSFQLPKPLSDILSAPETIDALLEEYTDEDRLRFSDALFEALLDDTRTKNPLALESTLSQITTLRTAVHHHVKLRTALELFLLGC
jgi:DNA polymerase III delta prime subunit